MDLINLSTPAQLALRALAPIAGLMPKTVMQLRYRRWTGHWIDWKRPKNLQEYVLAEAMRAAADPERLRLYADLSDKVAVRRLVADRVGKQALTMLYGTWTNADEIDFDAIPVPCVIKTNNDCGTNLIIRERKPKEYARYRQVLRGWMVYPYGKISGQPHYSAIKSQILAEEFLVQKEGSDELPYDYKFFCFNGEPQFILFYAGRKVNSHMAQNMVYDTDWKPIEGVALNPADHEQPRPEAFDKMLYIARRLSGGFPFVRVDMYGIGPRAILGEMTFTPDVSQYFTPAFLAAHIPA